MVGMTRNWSELDPRWNGWYYCSGLHPSMRFSGHFGRNGTDLITMADTTKLKGIGEADDLDEGVGETDNPDEGVGEADDPDEVVGEAVLTSHFATRI